jgi:peptidoglycan/LPS O-acetylase OafA/YrhL
LVAIGEEVFYLLWAPVVLLGSRRLILTASIFPVLFCPAFRLMAHNQSFGECFGFLPRMDSLAFGACIALLFLLHQRSRITQRTLRSIFVAGFVICAVALLCILSIDGAFRGIDVRSLTSFSVFGYTLVAMACACGVGLCVAFSGHRLLSPLRLRSILYLGELSYVMYLIHIPVFIGVFRLEKKLYGSGVLPGIGCAVSTVAVVILIASFSWRYFEQPILRLKDRIFASPGRSLNREIEPPTSESAGSFPVLEPSLES